MPRDARIYCIRFKCAAAVMFGFLVGRFASQRAHQEPIQDSVTNKACILSNSSFSKGELSREWLSDMLFRSNHKNELKVGNPQTRDEWIKSKAAALATGRKLKLLDMSAGNKPYEDTFTRAGFMYSSSEFAGNTELTDTFRGEQGVKDVNALVHKHTYLSEDINNTTAPSDHFDVAVLTEVLEHLPEPLEAIRELARVVKSGGHILVTAPFTSGSHQTPYHFSSGYPREWYSYAAEKFSLK